MKKFKFNPSDLGEVLTCEELTMVYGDSETGKSVCNVSDAIKTQALRHQLIIVVDLQSNNDVRIETERYARPC